MTLEPFALERFFSRYEFHTRHLLCASDAESMGIGELLALEPAAQSRLQSLRLGYTETRGGDALRAAIAAGYENADLRRVLVHGGSEEAIFSFANVVLNAGDHAIVQFPAYQSHYAVAQALGAEVSAWHSDLDGAGSPDVEELEALIRPTTRAIVLTTPNNPTGFAFDSDQQEAIIAIARRHGLWIFSDEVYRGTERDVPRIPALADRYERGVSLGGLSKAYGLAGVRIGWIVTPDLGLYERMANFKDYLSICNAAPSELLAEIALRRSEVLLERVRRIVVANLELLDAFFAARPSLFRWHRPGAGTTAFPRYLKGSSEEFCARLVERAGVLLLPSRIFEAGDAHVRFGYGRADLPQALAALDAYVAKERS